MNSLDDIVIDAEIFKEFTLRYGNERLMMAKVAR